MKMMRVGSRSSCPSNHASRAAFTVLRRCSAAGGDFCDLATLEEPPERADGDGDAALLQPLPQFRQRNVALGGQGRKDQLGMRLDPLRMAGAALALGPGIALAPVHRPPPGRARRTAPKPLSRRST